MALINLVVAANLRSYFAENAIIGNSSSQLALAIANGFTTYMLSAPVVQTLDVGSAGAGAGNGVGLAINPQLMALSFQSSLTSVGINGVMRTPLIVGLVSGYLQSLSIANILTTHAGTGVGTGTIINVIPNPLISIPTMIAGFVSVGLIGSMSVNLATGIALGFDQVLPTAKGQVVIVGPPSTSPGGGTGIGKVL